MSRQEISSPDVEPVETDTRSVWVMLILPPLTLAVVIFAYVGSAQLNPSAPNFEQHLESALPYLLGVNHLALFGLLLFILNRRQESLARIGWNVGGSSLPVELLWGLLGALALYLFKEFAIDSLRALLDGRAPTFTSLFRFDLSGMRIPMAIAASGLVFVEESIYRGFAIPRLGTRFTLPTAVVISTVFFSLLHWGYGPFALVSSFLFGLILAIMFLWRGNLVAVTVAHAGYNLLVLAVA